MLEARAHKHLKNLLQVAACPWPHSLTLSRLVARTLRRRDSSLIQIEGSNQDCWWLALLVPLCLEPTNAVLILTESQRHRLLKVELPRLQEEGLRLSFWQGSQPAPQGHVWLIDHLALVNAFYQGSLKSKHLIIPEAELLSERLRKALALEIKSKDWEKLRHSCPFADFDLLQLYERLTRRIFINATRVDAQVRIDSGEIVAVKDLLGSEFNIIFPWADWFGFDSNSWATWAELDHKKLQWNWNLQLLEPLNNLQGLLTNQPVLLLSGGGQNSLLCSQLESIDCQLNVKVKLGGNLLQEPISLFAPRSQPLPNTEFYAQHLLDQCRRLILGLKGITILLIDDEQLRLQLTSELASEFGRRVVHENIHPKSNGVVSCRCSWWLSSQNELPLPAQLIVGVLPFATLEEPLIAARVDALKREGRDWFRELLLPEALRSFSQAVAPLRINRGRLAILDGRVRSRSWGEHFYRALEPWTSLQRLLPDETPTLFENEF